MRDMYYRGQPLSEILKASYSEMKMCYRFSEEIADAEAEAIKAAKTKPVTK